MRTFLANLVHYSSGLQNKQNKTEQETNPPVLNERCLNECSGYKRIKILLHVRGFHSQKEISVLFRLESKLILELSQTECFDVIKFKE